MGFKREVSENDERGKKGQRGRIIGRRSIMGKSIKVAWEV